jgi:hypothetical protein
LIASILRAFGDFSEYPSPNYSRENLLAERGTGQLPAIGQAIKDRVNFMPVTANRADVKCHGFYAACSA